MSTMTLRPVKAGEVYVAVSDKEAHAFSGYARASRDINRRTIQAIFEPLNVTANVLVVYAQDNLQQVMPRDNVKIFNVETGELRLAWDIISSETRTI